MSDQNHDSPKPLRVAGIDIPAQERSPLVLLLVGLIQKQAAEIQELRDETQRLKGITGRTTVKPNLLMKPEDKKRKQPPSKRPGSSERHKTQAIRIDQDRGLLLDTLPSVAVLEGYRAFVVQDLVIPS
jgi:hypothetical protein